MSRLSTPTGLSILSNPNASGETIFDRLSARRAAQGESIVAAANQRAQRAASSLSSPFAQALSRRAAEGDRDALRRLSQLQTQADQAAQRAQSQQQNFGPSRVDQTRQRLEEDRQRGNTRMLQSSWEAIQRAAANPNNPLTEEQFEAVVGQWTEQAAGLNMPAPIHLFKAESEDENPQLRLAAARDSLQTSLGEQWQPKYGSMVKLDRDGQPDFTDYHRERQMEAKFASDQQKQQTAMQKELFKMQKEMADQEIKILANAMLSDLPQESGGFLGFGGTTKEEAVQGQMARLQEFHRLQQQIYQQRLPQLFGGGGEPQQPQEQQVPESLQMSPQEKAESMELHFAPSREDAVRLRREGVLRPGDRFVGPDGNIYTVQR